MHYYAQITGGVVSAVTQTSGPINAPDMVSISGLLDISGHSYDPATGAFTPPPPPPPGPRHITVGSFFDRFGSNKWPILADPNMVVQALIKDCSVRKHIDLDDAQLPAGLELLVESGHPIDVQVILNAPVLATERP